MFANGFTGYFPFFNYSSWPGAATIAYQRPLMVPRSTSPHFRLITVPIFEPARRIPETRAGTAPDSASRLLVLSALSAADPIARCVLWRWKAIWCFRYQIGASSSAPIGTSSSALSYEDARKSSHRTVRRKTQQHRPALLRFPRGTATTSGWPIDPPSRRVRGAWEVRERSVRGARKARENSWCVDPRFPPLNGSLWLPFIHKKNSEKKRKFASTRNILSIIDRALHGTPRERAFHGSRRAEETKLKSRRATHTGNFQSRTVLQICPLIKNIVLVI